MKLLLLIEWVEVVNTFCFFFFFSSSEEVLSSVLKVFLSKSNIQGSEKEETEDVEVEVLKRVGVGDRVTGVDAALLRGEGRGEDALRQWIISHITEKLVNGESFVEFKSSELLSLFPSSLLLTLCFKSTVARSSNENISSRNVPFNGSNTYQVFPTCTCVVLLDSLRVESLEDKEAGPLQIVFSL